ncbi:hypothetical protein ABZ901_13025 [Actinacidiphila alni]|uniref:hypothetical protein n=1 Tax=Actinacidiphila alni TaxID=380248 RepID=UPI0033FBF4D1
MSDRAERADRAERDRDAPAAGGRDPGGDPFEQPAPTGEEKAACWSVRHRAQGMSHHEVKAALTRARELAADGTDESAAAAAGEWERIADLMVDHAGRYDIDIDPFVQGELAGESHAPGRGRK